MSGALPAALGEFPIGALRAGARPAALELLGSWLVVGTGTAARGGIIVETEAYLSAGDASCHAHSGPTRRNGAMFGPAGRAYVYRIYGLHYCLNVVTGADGEGEAVLIRALEPRLGLRGMARRRGRAPGNADELCSGPGKLVAALGIEPRHDGAALVPEAGAGAGPLLLTGPRPALHRIEVSRRVGITRAAGLALRFRLRDSPWTSRAR